MQRKLSHWLAGLAAIAVLGASVPPTPAVAAPGDDIRMNTLSGAFLAGRVAEGDDDLAAAINYYRQALGFDPDNQGLQQNLMLALISTGRFDEALPYAQKLKTVPEVERVSRLALAVNDMRAKKYDSAQNWLKLALESDLDRLIVSLIGAWAQQGQGDTDGALKSIEDLNGPDWYGIFLTYHRALIADTAGRKDIAEKAFQEALEDTNGGSAAPDAYLRSAEAYAGFLARAGRKDDALKVIARGEEFAANRISLRMLRDQIEKGQVVPMMVANPVEGSSEVLLNLGMALNRGGGEPFVRLYLQLALALRPTNDFALMNLAELDEQAENPQGAIDAYRKVPVSSPFKRMADMQLGLNLADMDKKDEAIDHLKKLLASDPKDMRAYLSLGGVYASKEDFRSAADLYDTAVENLSAPTRLDWNVFYQRGIAYERLKEWQKAEPNFKKALELYPDQPQVMNYLGYSWVDMDRNLEEGLTLIRKAVDLRPSDGYIVDSLGWAYYKLGRFDEAVTELERAVSLKPDDPVLNDHLGDAYWRAGRKLEATFQWNHARDLKPEPNVLASVLKKLREGLPELQVKSAGLVPVAPQPATPPSEAPQTPAVSPAPVQPAAPAQQPAAPASVPADGSHVVLPGQSLWSIAVERLGNGERYREIIELNPQLRNPGRLVPGLEIKLPSR